MRSLCFLLTLLLPLSNSLLFAKESTGIFSTGTSINSSAVDCERSQSSEILEINNVRTIIMAGGDAWWTVLGAGNANYEIPKNDDPNVPKKHSMFAGSIWIGGRDEITGNLLVLANTYRQSHYSMWTGPLYESNPVISADQCAAWDRHFKLDRETIEEFIADLESDRVNSESDVPEAILYWPARGNIYINDVPGMQIVDMNRDLAPFEERFDEEPDGIYDPVEGDIPFIYGDEAIWYVMNDAGNVKEFGSITGGVGAEAIGMEVQAMAFGFATSDVLNDMTFYWNRLLNRGVKPMSETRMAQWADPDLGFADDDYVQVDVERGLGICYNGDDFDEGINGYGENPPCIGVDYFEGPWADLDTIGDGLDNDGDGVVDESDQTWRPDLTTYEGDGLDNDKDGTIDEPDELIIMSNFLYYNNITNDPVNGNPGSATHFFNYMRNIWADNSLCTYDLKDGTDQTFQPCDFMFPGTSDLEIGWGLGGNSDAPYVGSDNVEWDEVVAGNVPGDRRMLQSAGPFTLRPGAVNELTIGIPWARTGSGGARGSCGKLLIADDICQELFERDFQLKSGPDAPHVSVTEMNREIILSVEPSEFTLENQGKREDFNTETYREYEPKSNSWYTFQGYLFYQLADGSASAADLDNPDKARLVAQCDLVDGVTRIVNYVNDIELGPEVFVPVVEVEGIDNGIFRSVSLKQDAFAEGDAAMVNHRTYYYMVIAYGYNPVEDDRNDSPRVIDRQGTPYIQGRRNVVVTTAIPHQPIGEVLNSNYGEQFEITAEHGIGNGAGLLELLSGREDELLDGFSGPATYRSGFGPLDVKVVDPRVLRDIDRYEVELSSRLVYANDNAVQFHPGDTIVSIGDYTRAVVQPPVGSVNINGYVKQTNGKAVVIREVQELETDTAIVLEVRLLNGADGGRFTKEVTFSRSGTFDGYGQEPVPFRLDNGDSSFSALAIEFKANDFWTLQADGVYRKSARAMSSGFEEVIPELGISLKLEPGTNPGYRPGEELTNPDNGLLDGLIEYSVPTQPWLIPVSFEDIAWQADQLGINPADPNKVYQNVLFGGAGPYVFGKENTSASAFSPFVRAGTAPEDQGSYGTSFSGINNIDLVFTPNDPSQWTRCAVLQFKEPEGSPVPALFRRSQKSTVLSVGKDGNPDGTKTATGADATGWSWFPGYAIDLDRGERVHIWIAESRERDEILGNDLLYNPDTSSDALKHFVILTNRVYDFGPNGEGAAYQDEVDAMFTDPSVQIATYGPWYAEQFSWMGYFRANPFLEIEEESRADIKVKLRVMKDYVETENGENPMYTFSSRGMGARTEDQARAQSDLDRIRLVPNPYYAYSQYETSQVDKRVKITDIPSKCNISIFTISGALVRQFRVDNPEDVPGEGLTSVDWNLTNQDGLPVASGVYIVHVDAGELGEKVVKFFNIARPIDLDTF